MGSIVIYKGIPCKLLAAETPFPQGYKSSRLILSFELFKRDLAVGDIQMR